MEVKKARVKNHNVICFFLTVIYFGHELGHTLGDGEGQRGLPCCRPWGHKESDMTWRLNSNNKYILEEKFYNNLCIVNSPQIFVE